MELTSFEQDMLDGKHGEGMALAMKVQVGTGRAFYAKRMVPITRAHVAASAQQGDIYFVTKLVEGGATLHRPAHDQPQHGPGVRLRAPLGDGPVRASTTSRPATRPTARSAPIMTLNCTPELEKNVPAFGEIVAFSESSATPYVNSVLGARTNRESSISALCAAVTGRVPEYGFLLDENRRAEVSSRSRPRSRRTSTGTCSATPTRRCTRAARCRCSRASRSAPTPEGFVQFGAELATSGSVAMYHIAGITPEAPDRRDRPRRQGAEGDGDDHRRPTSSACASSSPASPGPIEYAMFGCPHLTIRQVGEIAAQIQGRRFAVDTWILVSSLTLELAERMGYLATIQRAGGHVIPDTCMDVPGCWDIYYDRPGRHRVAEVRLLLPGVRTATTRCGRWRRPSKPPSRGRSTDGRAQREFSCRCISEGVGEGAALLSKDALCFALCDPTTGTVVEKGHALDCQSVAGRVLVMPTGKGSSVVQADGLYRLIINNVAPAAVVLERPEPVLVSTIIAMEIPLVDEVDPAFYEAVANGDAVTRGRRRPARSR